MAPLLHEGVPCSPREHTAQAPQGCPVTVPSTHSYPHALWRRAGPVREHPIMAPLLRPCPRTHHVRMPCGFGVLTAGRIKDIRSACFWPSGSEDAQPRALRASDGVALLGEGEACGDTIRPLGGRSAPAPVARPLAPVAGGPRKVRRAARRGRPAAGRNHPHVRRSHPAQRRIATPPSQRLRRLRRCQLEVVRFFTCTWVSQKHPCATYVTI
jgi:hypothetical protein